MSSSAPAMLLPAEPPVLAGEFDHDRLLTVPRELISRENDPSRPCIENRVAYQWESRGDVIGFRHGVMRDATILDCIASGLQTNGTPKSVLDVGCGYGNHLFMLCSRLGKRSNFRLVGVNLDSVQLGFAQAFANSVSGYENCEFRFADLVKGLPFGSDEFDVVSISDVLEHMTDPHAALVELRRVTRPGGLIVLSTPLKDGLFKLLAKVANTATGGLLYRAYYRGKNTQLDERGRPIMSVRAGNDHVSEMNLRQLTNLAESAGLQVKEKHLMQIMSGSRWFDRHPFLLSALLFLEAVHGVLRRPSWAHSVTLVLQKPTAL